MSQYARIVFIFLQQKDISNMERPVKSPESEPIYYVNGKLRHVVNQTGAS